MILHWRQRPQVDNFLYSSFIRALAYAVRKYYWQFPWMARTWCHERRVGQGFDRVILKQAFLVLCLTTVSLNLNVRLILFPGFRLFTVSSLRCNVCISYSSWDDCAKSQNPLTCEPVDTHCFRHMVHVDMGFYKTTTFAKSCATSDKCTPEAVNRCKNSSGYQQMGIKDVKCDLKCCQGDLCN